jgi:hypothetical protein
VGDISGATGKVRVNFAGGTPAGRRQLQGIAKVKQAGVYRRGKRGVDAARIKTSRQAGKILQ